MHGIRCRTDTGKWCWIVCGLGPSPICWTATAKDILTPRRLCGQHGHTDTYFTPNDYFKHGTVVLVMFNRFLVCNRWYSNGALDRHKRTHTHTHALINMSHFYLIFIHTYLYENLSYHYCTANNKLTLIIITFCNLFKITKTVFVHRQTTQV